MTVDSLLASVHQTAAAVARIRTEAHLTQAVVAEKAGLDQSRVSRIEKGEVASAGDVERVLDALTALGAASSGIQSLRRSGLAAH